MDIDPFFTRLNPLIGGLLGSRLHWIASRGLLLLTVTGRRSGRRYSIPVGYEQERATLVVRVSHAARKNWWRNYLESRPVEMVLRGRRATGQALVLDPGSEEFTERLASAFERIPMLDRQFGVRFDKGKGLDAAQLEHLRADAAIVKIALDPRASEPTAPGATA